MNDEKNAKRRSIFQLMTMSSTVVPPKVELEGAIVEQPEVVPCETAFGSYTLLLRITHWRRFADAFYFSFDPSF